MKLHFFLLSLLAIATSANVIEQTWVISHKLVSPDGVEKLVPVVNGQYPGPQLRGKAGDLVKITVINKMPVETTTIHWHGIKQDGTPWSDGVPGISQCPIGPNEQFLYEFVLDAPGTLWWHSHSGLQKSSLYGVIIIEGDEHVVGEHGDVTLLLNDWYHESSANQIAGLLRPIPDFKWVGDAQSLLFNGKGEFDCSQTTKPCDPDAPDSGPFILDVNYSTSYRLRLVGASSLAFINFGIDDHKIEMVEVETQLLKRFSTRYLDLGPGQSYSAILQTKSKAELMEMEDNNGLFYMQLNVRHRPTGPTGVAILRYPDASGDMPSNGPRRAPAWDDVEWSLRHARRFGSLDVVTLPEASRVFTYLGTQNEQADGRLLWALNNISYVEEKTPILHAMAFEIPETEGYTEQTSIPRVFDYNMTLDEGGIPRASIESTQVVRVRHGEVIDFVFQNTRALNGADEIHPWHLHLHNFWVLGYGEAGEFWDAETSPKKYRMKDAVSRNTFSLYPLSWTAIRVRFDNRGAAHFHCHILAHLVMGMGFVVRIGDGKDVPAPPQGTQFCGTITKMTGTPLRNPLIFGGCKA